jgi:hypothetical protein
MVLLHKDSIPCQQLSEQHWEAAQYLPHLLAAINAFAAASMKF